MHIVDAYAKLSEGYALTSSEGNLYSVFPKESYFIKVAPEASSKKVTVTNINRLFFIFEPAHRAYELLTDLSHFINSDWEILEESDWRP